MATTQETKVVDPNDDFFFPEPTAAPDGDILARRGDVDWIIGRETCGFYSSSSEVNGTSWQAFDCPMGSCTISDSYVGCDSMLRTACHDFYGSDCPGGRGRKRQATDVLCCTQEALHCVTAIMTLAENEFLTGYQCLSEFEGEMRLYPSTIDESQKTSSFGGTPTVETAPTSALPLGSSGSPKPQNGGGPNVNIGAVAGGLISGIGVALIVAVCIAHVKSRRKFESGRRAPRPQPVLAPTDYPHPPRENTYEKPDEQLPRVATEMPALSTLGSNTASELPAEQRHEIG